MAKKQKNSDQTGAPAPKRGGLGLFVGVALIGGLAAGLANPGSRKKILDLLFGAEEEFDYNSMTTSNGNGASAQSSAGTAANG